MGGSVNQASREALPDNLTEHEIAKYVQQFRKLDRDGKGFISVNDLRSFCRVRLGRLLLAAPAVDKL